MESFRKFTSKSAGMLAVIGFAVLMGFNIVELGTDTFSQVGAFMVLAIIVGLWGLAVWHFGDNWYVGWISFALVVVLLITAGGSLISFVTGKAGPVASVTIDNTTTYVAPPTSIQDPALRSYETKKMGFDSDWLANWGGGTYLFIAFCFGLAMLFDFWCKKQEFVFLNEPMDLRGDKPMLVYFSIPVELVLFVIGSIIIGKVLWPSGFADAATIAAENNAILWGFAGPFLWEGVLEWAGWIWTKSKNAGQTMMETNDGRVFLGVVLLIVTYPLVGGLSSLFDFDLLKTLALSHDLTNTAITMQRWTELFLSGKYLGLFMVPTIKFAYKLIKAVLKRWIIG